MGNKFILVLLSALCINLSATLAQEQDLDRTIMNLSILYGEGSVALAEALGLRAAEFSEKNDWQSALYLYEKALSVNSLADDPGLKLDILYQLSVICSHLGNFEKGLEYAGTFQELTRDLLGEDSDLYLEALLLIDYLLGGGNFDPTKICDNLESIIDYCDKNDRYSELWFNSIYRLALGEAMVVDKKDQAYENLHKYQQGIIESKSENTSFDVYGYLLSYQLSLDLSHLTSASVINDLQEAFKRCKMLPPSSDKDFLEYLIYRFWIQHADSNETEDFVNRFIQASEKVYAKNSLDHIESMLHAAREYALKEGLKNLTQSINLATEIKTLLEDNGEELSDLYYDTLVLLGDVESLLSNTDSAISYYLLCEKRVPARHPKYFPSLYLGLAHNFCKKEDFLDAFDYLTKAEEYVADVYGRKTLEYAEVKETFLGYYGILWDVINYTSTFLENIDIYERHDKFDYRFLASLGMLAEINPEACATIINEKRISDIYNKNLLEPGNAFWHDAAIMYMARIAASLIEAGFPKAAQQLAITAKCAFRKSRITAPDSYGRYQCHIGKYDCLAGNYEEGLAELYTGLEYIKEMYGEGNGQYTNGLLMYAEMLFRHGTRDKKTEAVDLMYRAFDLFSDSSAATSPALYYLSVAIMCQFHLNRNVDKDRINEYVSTFRSFASSTLLKATEEDRKNLLNSTPQMKDILFSLESTQISAEQLYDYSLLYKGLLLNSGIEISTTILHSNDQELISLYHKYLSMKNATANAQYRDTESYPSQQIDSLERTILSAYREISGKKTYADYSFTDIRAALKEGDVALEFITYTQRAEGGDEESVNYDVLVAKKDWSEPKRIHLFGSEALKKYSNLKHKIYDDSHPASHELFDMIWGPLVGYFDSGTVYFSPSEELSLLAIEYLPMHNGKTLSEVFSIKRVSSTREICISPERRNYAQSVLYGGLNYDNHSNSFSNSDINPLFGSKQVYSFSRGGYEDPWDKLPGTASEVMNIGRLLTSGKVNSSIITGMDGTETSFRSLSGQSLDILHIATHGFFIKENEIKKVSNLDIMEPRQSPETAMLTSGLILSGANDAWLGINQNPAYEDGILTASEISTLNLSNIDLVVLSACETGLGSVSDEGVYGLQRAFKMAGVDTIIMSLWQVDDDATLMLMTELYKNILKGISKQQALQRAITKVRNYKGVRKINGRTEKVDYSDPFYWAPFIMLD